MGPVAGGSIRVANVNGAGVFQSSVVVTDARIAGRVSALVSSLVHAWLGELSATLTHVPSEREASLAEAPRAGFEPATCGLEDRCSIQAELPGRVV